MAPSVDREAILDALRSMEPEEVEAVVAEVFEAEGYATTVTQGSRDELVDVEAELVGPATQKLAIQVKRYDENNRVGRPEVQKYASVPHDHRDFDSVAIVTTSEFANTAKSYAYDNPIDLIDGKELADMILRHGVTLDAESPMADQVSNTASEAVERPSERRPAKPKTELRGFFLAVVVTHLALVAGFPTLMYGPTELLGAFLLMIGLFGGPIAIGLDALYLRRYDGNYQPTLLWVWGALISIGLLGVWYAIRRALRTDLRAAFGAARDLDEP